MTTPVAAFSIAIKRLWIRRFLRQCPYTTNASVIMSHSRFKISFFSAPLRLCGEIFEMILNRGDAEGKMVKKPR
jgi:hypothetical protein